MVSIEKSFPKGPSPQLVKSDGQPLEGPEFAEASQSTGGENQVPVILAKAAVAAKMQAVAGMGRRAKTTPRSGGPSDNAQDSGRRSMKQVGFHEDDLVRNLKKIVTDDKRWGLFALGALGLQPGTESCESLRDDLKKGFQEDSDGIANLAALYSEGMPAGADAATSVPTDDLSSGLIERTKLWLTFTDYFENLFSAVREKNLPNNLDLYTDERLIKYLHTIGQ